MTALLVMSKVGAVVEGLAMVMVRTAVPVPALFVAETGTLKTPAVVGVPRILPEDVSMPRPAGRLVAE